METRKSQKFRDTQGTTPRTSGLPKEYLQQITELLSSHYGDALETVKKYRKNPHFLVDGKIFPEEIVLSASLVFEGELSANTLFASIDFDPKASAPSVHELLGACVDALGHFFNFYLSPELLAAEKVLQSEAEKRLLHWLNHTLDAEMNWPFEWTPLELDRFKVYLFADKSNPVLDRMTEDWLKKNDPHYEENEKADEERVKDLFVTGEKARNTRGNGEGSIH